VRRIIKLSRTEFFKCQMLIIRLLLMGKNTAQERLHQWTWRLFSCLGDLGPTGKMPYVKKDKCTS
jgi:hypothetical protein